MNLRAALANGLASHVHESRLGILAMIGAMACFIINDALVKYASQTMPAAQLIFIRGVMASVLVLAVARAMAATRRIGEIARGWVAVRAGIDAIATLLYLVSLFHLPLANATAINMTSPLFITVLAALFIGERVGTARWLAIGVGFLGVVLVIQPQAEGFNVYALVCLLATLLIAVRDLVTRRVHAGVPSILITLSNTVAVMLLAGALSLIEGWRPLRAFEIGLLAVAAAFLATAYYLIVTSTRRGDLSLVVPFRYTALLFAAVAGFVVWGDRPNALAWCGIALVIASGIYVLRTSRRARVAPAVPDSG
jgi:drug/metabolite transporter (DMT)-like permease